MAPLVCYGKAACGVECLIYLVARCFSAAPPTHIIVLDYFDELSKQRMPLFLSCILSDRMLGIRRQMHAVVTELIAWAGMQKHISWRNISCHSMYLQIRQVQSIDSEVSSAGTGAGGKNSRLAALYGEFMKAYEEEEIQHGGSTIHGPHVVALIELIGETMNINMRLAKLSGSSQQQNQGTLHLSHITSSWGYVSHDSQINPFTVRTQMSFFTFYCFENFPQI
uniref:Uncharacterized protein n=1 Tax=Parascaris equorum TaxID=6256 RepID=A0A914S202_PAREQ